MIAVFHHFEGKLTFPFWGMPGFNTEYFYVRIYYANIIYIQDVLRFAIYISVE